MDETIDALDALIARFETEVAPLGDDQLDRPQEAEAWTARETTGHLILTARQYDEKLRALIQRHPEGRRPSDKPYKPKWMGAMLLKFLPNAARRFKAPKTFDPRRTEERFTAEQLVSVYRALRETATELRRLHLGRAVFGTPVSRFLRMRARDGVDVQIEHGKRHLAQILRAAGVT